MSEQKDDWTFDLFGGADDLSIDITDDGETVVNFPDPPKEEGTEQESADAEEGEDENEPDAEDEINTEAPETDDTDEEVEEAAEPEDPRIAELQAQVAALVKRLDEKPEPPKEAPQPGQNPLADLITEDTDLIDTFSDPAKGRDLLHQSVAKVVQPLVQAVLPIVQEFNFRRELSEVQQKHSDFYEYLPSITEEYKANPQATWEELYLKAKAKGRPAPKPAPKRAPRPVKADQAVKNLSQRAAKLATEKDNVTGGEEAPGDPNTVEEAFARTLTQLGYN